MHTYKGIVSTSLLETTAPTLSAKVFPGDGWNETLQMLFVFTQDPDPATVALQAYELDVDGVTWISVALGGGYTLPSRIQAFAWKGDGSYLAVLETAASPATSTIHIYKWDAGLVDVLSFSVADSRRHIAWMNDYIFVAHSGQSSDPAPIFQGWLFDTTLETVEDRTSNWNQPVPYWGGERINGLATSDIGDFLYIYGLYYGHLYRIRETFAFEDHIFPDGSVRQSSGVDRAMFHKTHPDKLLAIKPGSIFPEYNKSQVFYEKAAETGTIRYKLYAHRLEAYAPDIFFIGDKWVLINDYTGSEHATFNYLAPVGHSDFAHNMGLPVVANKPNEIVYAHGTASTANTDTVIVYYESSPYLKTYVLTEDDPLEATLTDSCYLQTSGNAGVIFADLIEEAANFFVWTAYPGATVGGEDVAEEIIEQNLELSESYSYTYGVVLSCVEKLITASGVSTQGVFGKTFADAVSLKELVKIAYQNIVADSIELDETYLYINTINKLIKERSTLGDTINSQAMFGKTFTDAVSLQELVSIAHQNIVTDGINLEEIYLSVRTISRQIKEHPILKESLYNQAMFSTAIYTALALHVVVQGGKGGSVSELMESIDSVILAAELAIIHNEFVNISAEANTFRAMQIMHKEIASVGDTSLQSLIASIQVTEQLPFQISFNTGDAAYTGWVMNTKTFAVTEYDSFPFNSFTTHDGVSYGANEQGLYRLEGDDDAGVPIAARAKLGLTNFNKSVLKRLDNVYIGLRADGLMVLKVETEGGVTRFYQLEGKNEMLHRRRIHPLAKGHKAVWWQFEIANVDGADFEVSEIEFVPVMLSRSV